MASITLNAKTLAARISAVLGRPINPKQVRSRVRGDAGTPVLAQYGESKAPYASHQYTVADANRVGAAFVKSHNARTGAGIEWPMLLADGSTSKRTLKPSNAKRRNARKSAQTAPAATQTPDVADSASE